MRGRPKKEDNYPHVLVARLNDEQKDMLNKLCKDLDLNQSECVRRCLSTLYMMRNT